MICLFVFSFLQDYLVSCQQRMESLLNKSLTPPPTLQIPDHSKHADPVDAGNDKPTTPTDVESVSNMIEAEAQKSYNVHVHSSWWL